MARSKRMERGQYSNDPFYYHTHDCQGCEQECNGIEGDRIAQDAKDIAGWTNVQAHGTAGGEPSVRPYNDQDDAEPLLEHYAHTQDAGTMNGGFSQKAA